MKHALGTICKLKGIDTNIIIIGYNSSSKTSNYTYNYVGCEIPEGFIDENKLYRFNNEHIDSVVFNGYEEKNFSMQERIPIDINTKNENLEKSSNEDENASKEILNNPKVETKSQSTDAEYVFDENGVLVAVNKKEKKEEVKEEPKSSSEPTSATLQSIDIDNL